MGLIFIRHLYMKMGIFMLKDTWGYETEKEKGI